MENQQIRCSVCASQMEVSVTNPAFVLYRCPNCGTTKQVERKEGEVASEYVVQRAQLISRLRKGILNWQGTNWHYLSNDMNEFIGKYSEAQSDHYISIALVACITEGFNVLDKEKYKQCKALFKVTEKTYKMESRELKLSYSETTKSRLAEYEEFRNLYKQCRGEYRKTKIYWKIISFVFKQLVFK